MANFSITTPQVVDSLNYVLSGPTNVGNDFTGKQFASDRDQFVYLTNETNGTLALTNPQGDPFIRPISEGPPGITSPPDTYIKTGMYVPVTITDPTQQINLTAQVRAWFSWTLSVPSTNRVYLAVNRYKSPNLTYDPYYFGSPDIIIEYSILITKVASDPPPYEGELITNGTTGMVYANLVDEPGELGTFYYWIEIYYEQLDGDMVFDWLGTDLTSISASKIINNKTRPDTVTKL